MTTSARFTEGKSKWRFSVAWMLIAVASLSLALAAILNANEWWFAGTSFLNAILFAVGLAGCFSPRHRFFCLAVTGIAVLIAMADGLALNITSSLPFYDLVPHFTNREYNQENVVRNVAVFVVAVVAGTISQVLFGKREQ